MRSRRLEIFLVAGLLLLQAVVQLLVRPNPRWTDGIFMLRYAQDFPDIPANHYTLRIGLLLPTRLFEEVLGYGQASYYAFPFLCSLLLVAATYLLGRDLFGPWAGAFAALLIVVNPTLVQTINFPGGPFERMTSWQLLPDIPSTALFTLGLALLVHGVQRSPVQALGGVLPHPGWLVSAGLCFGWAYLIREMIPFLFPLIAVVLLLWRVAWRRWLWVAGPLAASFAAELIVNAALYGDAFARFAAGEEQGSPPRQPLTRLKVLDQLPMILRENHATTAWTAAVVLTVLAPLLFRRRTHVLIAVWAVLYWVAMLVLSGLLNPDHITLRGQLARYWLPLIPALAIGAAGALRAAWGALRARANGPLLRRPTVTAAATAAVLVPFAVPVWNDIAHNPRDKPWSALRTYLDQHDVEVQTLVANDRDALNLTIYRRDPIGGGLAWHGRVVVVRHYLRRPPDPSPGQWLLWTTQLSQRPPGTDSGWALMMSKPGLRLYRAAGVLG